MSRFTWLLTAISLAAATTACSTARDPARGFRLAPNGDQSRGKIAFVEFGCNNCHEVEGSPMPKPAVTAVSLGGPVRAQHSDGYLVTAIINPKYHSAHHPIAVSAQYPTPLMPDFAARMTAYLQSRYSLATVQVPPEFP